MRRVMNRGGDGIEKSGIRVRRKVHRDRCLRHNRSDHFDIQHHFAIRTVRIAGRRILSMVDRNRGDRGRAQA